MYPYLSIMAILSLAADLLLEDSDRYWSFVAFLEFKLAWVSSRIDIFYEYFSTSPMGEIEIEKQSFNHLRFLVIFSIELVSRKS